MEVYSKNKVATLTVAVVAPLFLLVVFTPSVRAAFTSRLSSTALIRRWVSTKTTDASTAAAAAGMKRLPSNVVQYSQVPKKGSYFTAAKTPKGLLKDHTTKKGTWGVIRVTAGKLEYTIQEPTQMVYELSKDTPPGIIEPTVKHHVKPLTDDLQFVVEFYRLPNTGPVDEKREGL